METFMDYYYFIEAVIGIIAGLWIAIAAKKAEGITYGKLDRAGRIVNIVLLCVYTVFAPFYLFVASIFRPAYEEGFLFVIGLILSIIAASPALFAGLGLGASVALRKKGKSKLSFAAQFAGFAGIALMILIFFLGYGNILDTIN